MNKDYQIISKKNSRELATFLSKEGQLLLPMLELIEQAEAAVDEVIDVVGRASIEAILLLSAQQLAGHQHKGKSTGNIRWHGKQNGVVPLAERKLRIDKPRLRRKGKGKNLEIQIPVYEAMQTNSRLGQRILSILMHGISTRSYKKVLPEMAETVGVSKSNVSREFIEASEQQMKEFAERRFDDKDILIIYIDGIRFGQFHVIAALGVDSEGLKHVLGLTEGATENAAVVKDLLEDIVARGIDPSRKRLFVIDGSKALRNAVDTVFGNNPVQRCRKHKVSNVMDHLPKELKDQVKNVMQAAWRLDAEEGKKRIRQQAHQLEIKYPSAASSLLEGLDEMFTINVMGLPKALRRCLCTTNIIESPHSGVRMRTRRVSNWNGGRMVLRWATAAFLETEEHFQKISGYRQLWMLKSYLDDLEKDRDLAEKRKAG
ncbi:MAG TPA: IS256 family transposase [Sedimentisphaerales bacterium]|nr:IS256 family transposase [Sedimentisphaerales bacterium]